MATKKKPKMGRITEPDENLVHYEACSVTGNVTLCGLTDFIYAKERGEETDLPVTCATCKAIKSWCDSHSD